MSDISDVVGQGSFSQPTEPFELKRRLRYHFSGHSILNHFKKRYSVRTGIIRLAGDAVLVSTSSAIFALTHLGTNTYVEHALSHYSPPSNLSLNYAGMWALSTLFVCAITYSVRQRESHYDRLLNNQFPQLIQNKDYTLN